MNSASSFPRTPPVSPAFSLAAGRLAGRRSLFEFLLPKVTPLQQLAARYSSGRLRTAISAAAAVALVAGGLFFFQQCQLWRLESQWAKLQPTVQQLEGVQDQIRQYRPWFDESVRGLTILRTSHRGLPRRWQRDRQDRGDSQPEHGYLHRHRPRTTRRCSRRSRTVAQGPANPRREPGADSRATAGAAIHLQLPVE